MPDVHTKVFQATNPRLIIYDASISSDSQGHSEKFKFKSQSQFQAPDVYPKGVVGRFNQFARVFERKNTQNSIQKFLYKKI